MRSTRRNLGFSRNLLLAAGTVVMLSISSLTMLTEEALAFPDRFGIEQLYPTAGNGPVWFLDNEEPESDDNFLMTSHEGIDLEEEQEGAGRGSFQLDAETGTEEHGVRIHADSPNDRLL